MQDFAKQLRRQLGFLERSAASFDSGAVDEGIRIATTLRVLFHETRKQTPLVAHLQKPLVRLLDSAVPPQPITHRTLWYDGVGEYVLPAKGVPSYRPRLEAGPNSKYVPLPEWWESIVYVRAPDISLSRSHLILMAADKDGGAHVDAQLPPEYIAVTLPGVAGHGAVGANGTLEFVVAFRDLHLVSLRQLAFEVLNSPELLQLAG